MSTLRTICLVALLQCPGLLTAQVDETAEPPIEIVAQLDGVTVELVDGQTIPIEGEFKGPKLTVRLGPSRMFSYGGVRFAYPRDFSFKADVADKDVRTWHLSGNNLKLIVFVSTEDVSPKQFLDGVAAEFGKDNAEIVRDDSAITLGKTTYKGPMLKIKLAGTNVFIDVFKIPSQSGSRLFVVQRHGGVSDYGGEAVRVARLLKKTFTAE